MKKETAMRIPHHPLTGTAAATVAVLALIAGPAGAADQSQTAAASKNDAAMNSRASQTNQTSQISTISIMAANDLIGREVWDKDYNSVGTLQYMLIRPDTGRVVLALIGSDDSLASQKQFTAVPWDTLNADVWYGRFSPGLTLKVSHDKFSKATRWGIDRLTEMTTPVNRQQTFEYFGIADPDGATAGKDGATGSKDRSTASKDTATASNDVPHVFIGRGTITRAGAPALLAENQLRGIPVQTKLGGDLGNVDEVVIDLAHGRVAYVLLARGGYLGSGEEWIAAPIQAFEWHGLSATVDMSADDFKRLKGLDRTAYVPQWVREKDLKSLYSGFDVDPYWTKS